MVCATDTHTRKDIINYVAIIAVNRSSACGGLYDHFNRSYQWNLYPVSALSEQDIMQKKEAHPSTEHVHFSPSKDLRIHPERVDQVAIIVIHALATGLAVLEHLEEQVSETPFHQCYGEICNNSQDK